ncbi:unnamed protein product [Trichobilharzia regenti]|nr:unnamed protein product [Trichobilharzia regenti]
MLERAWSVKCSQPETNNSLKVFDSFVVNTSIVLSSAEERDMSRTCNWGAMDGTESRTLPSREPIRPIRRDLRSYRLRESLVLQRKEDPVIRLQSQRLTDLRCFKLKRLRFSVSNAFEDKLRMPESVNPLHQLATKVSKYGEYVQTDDNETSVRFKQELISRDFKQQARPFRIQFKSSSSKPEYPESTKLVSCVKADETLLTSSFGEVKQEDTSKYSRAEHRLKRGGTREFAGNNHFESLT